MKLLDKGVWKPFEKADNYEISSNFPNSIESAEKNRYHLYVSYACPWAHRTIIYRTLKGLEDYVPMSILDPRWGSENGWYFKSDYNKASTDETTVDHALGLNYLWEVYANCHPDYVGKVTVPVLFDRKHKKIVSNESSVIIRILDELFPSDKPLLRPKGFHEQVDELNNLVQNEISVRIYQAGFAKDQKSYENYSKELFKSLKKADELLDKREYLIADRPLESDIHLFCALVRFDLVYYSALRLNLYPLTHFKNLIRFVQRLLGNLKIQESFKPDHIKSHYFDNIEDINPKIIPLGPNLKYINQ